jgi:hypothetical protein
MRFFAFTNHKDTEAQRRHLVIETRSEQCLLCVSETLWFVIEKELIGRTNDG